jgi:hypothetical protein
MILKKIRETLQQNVRFYRVDESRIADQFLGPFTVQRIL